MYLSRPDNGISNRIVAYYYRYVQRIGNNFKRFIFLTCELITFFYNISKRVYKYRVVLLYYTLPQDCHEFEFLDIPRLFLW